MAVTLTYGYELPETGDLGSVWFPALEDNIDQLNDHTHNGTNSAKITGTSVTATTVSAPSGSWVLVAGGRYRQSVTVPAGIDVDDYILTAKTAAGIQIFPGTEKITDTTFYIYCNDNSLTLTVYFAS